MRVRKLGPEEGAPAVELARSLGLDYPGLAGDEIWAAEDAGRIVGIVALKTHPDCLELCALGVDPRHRGRGVAKVLVEALMAGAPGDVHLATIIPGFFEGCGFRRVGSAGPATFPARRSTAWCEGCPKDLCTVMVREKGA
ncbi:MAG: GNAT family N-acetyltransferase [Candidatus Aminicenantes bacterium]|nr:GNAT family N-acetyltransferase [Candidatus Aminicenantes bacterium]